MKQDYKLLRLWVFLFLVFFSLVFVLLLDVSLIWQIIFVLTLLFIFSRVNWKYFPSKLFLIAFLARLMVVLCIETVPESDFGFQLMAAQQLINGDTDFLHAQLAGMDYFQMWPYHLGIVALDAFWLTIWNSVYMLQLMNCLTGSLTAVLIYLISCEFTEEKSARIASLLYCFLPFSWTYVTVLTNQFYATLLSAFGLYLIISERIKMNNVLRYSLLGGILGIANAIRPESIIPLFATGLSLVLCVRKTNFKTNFVSILSMLVAYFSMQFLINQAFILAGLTEDGLINTNPYWKIAVGLNAKTAGGWSESDYFLAADSETCIALIKERVCQPVDTLIKLMIVKVQKTWAGGELFWALHHTVEAGGPILGKTMNLEKVYEFLVALNKGWAMMIHMLMLVGSYKLAKEHRIEFKHILLVNQIFVPLGVFQLVEAQTRYIHSFQIYMFVLASIGITYLKNKNRLKKLML